MEKLPTLLRVRLLNFPILLVNTATILCVSSILLLTACTKKKACPEGVPLSADLHLVADSIKYEVIVKPTSDDLWEAERLSGYNGHKQLIQSIFKGISNGELDCYDFFSGEPLSPEAIKLKLGDDFNRPDKVIGKILFIEQWYVDSKGRMYKKVKSITLGKEEYSKQGTFKGYSALFTVKYR